MLEILKILKRYTFGIILIIFLLYLQAKCDLALPEYTSNIINIGIQQKGVESIIPDEISNDTFKILSAITNDEKIINSYTLSRNNTYILNDINEEEKTYLEDNLLLPEVIIYMVNSTNSFEGIELESSIQTFTASDIAKIDSFKKQFSEMDESMLKQYAVNFVISEYEKVDIDLEKKQMSYLYKEGTEMLLITVFMVIVIILATYLSSVIGSRFAYDTREKMMNQIMSYSNHEFNKFSTSSLITRTTNDVAQVRMFITMLLRMVLYAPIVGFGAISKVIGMPMAWIIAVTVGVLILLIIILMLFVLPKFKLVQKLVDKLNKILREVISGLPVIRAFANESFEKKKFDSANKELMGVNLFTQKTMALMEPLMTIIMNGTIVLIYWMGANSIDTGTIQVGTLTAFVSYTMQIIMSFLMISMISIMAPRAMISINRISEVLKHKQVIKNKDKTTSFGNTKGKLEFKNVNFKYPDGDDLVLENISFTCEPGTTTAIIGSTGSGKSSIIKLIPRLFDITDGSVLVDDVDIRDANLKILREKIGMVPQKGLLFSGTIESNIKYNNIKMSDEEMIRAAKIACADEFIEEKKEKYKAEISQGGTNVSGGQKQRLCIARAVAKNPEIYLFDDCFSALDYKTDATVRKNLERECKDSTKLIVAQRVATVMNADQIIVLDQGKIVGIGTHKELFKSCKEYKEIALSQLREEELV